MLCAKWLVLCAYSSVALPNSPCNITCNRKSNRIPVIALSAVESVICHWTTVVESYFKSLVCRFFSVSKRMASVWVYLQCPVMGNINMKKSNRAFIHGSNFSSHALIRNSTKWHTWDVLVSCEKPSVFDGMGENSRNRLLSWALVTILAKEKATEGGQKADTHKQHLGGEVTAFAGKTGCSH